ncbi:hypothetical protein RRG08_037676 [Elysia crispata]|uniref:Major facilitator superfamily (MFS) profile domain-containing protein n=1 Tax=Elysia crispata TaxID=231223 RepID=A0AAE1A7Y5_9GAST|nr:hypothetical protein RRG08_037676 [Elysia crispata]
MHTTRRKLCVLIGATLNAFPLSLLSYYGNILPYIASFYHAHINEMTLYVDPLWITSSFVCAYTISMILTSPMEIRFGLPTCLLVSNVLLSLSVMSGYFTVREPLALALIFGGVQGISVGALYTLTLKLLLQIMTDQKGVASGIMTSGPVIGALVNIGLAFAIINPSNKKPDLEVDKRFYFSDKDLIDRVPFYFLVSGAITVASSFIGTGLMFLAMSDMANKTHSKTASSSRLLLNKQNDDSHKLSAEIVNECVPLKDFKAQMYNINKPIQDHCKGPIETFGEKETILREERKGNDHSLEKQGSMRDSHQADMHPKKVLKTAVFWCVWVAFMSSNHTTYLQMNLYKQYGQQSISDDSKLVITGIVSNVGMVFVRPLVGLLSDKFGIRNTTIAFHFVSCIFMCLLVVVLRTCPLLYMIFVVIENVGVSPHTLLFSILTTIEFGNTHFASNMGLVCSGNIALILLEPYLVNAIVMSIGWDWLFLSGCGSAIIATVSIMAMNWLS